MLADEPTGNLDTRRGGETLALLRQVAGERGVAVLLVTHDPLAAAAADRVLTLRDGRLDAAAPAPPARTGAVALVRRRG